MGSPLQGLRLRIEGQLDSEDDLPTDLGHGRHSADVGRAWIVNNFFWHVWTGNSWFVGIRTAEPKALAS